MSNVEMTRKTDRSLLGLTFGGAHRREARDENEPIITFRRGDLRQEPRRKRRVPRIDFIEVRLGSLPESSDILFEDGQAAWSTPFQRLDWLDTWWRHEGGQALAATAVGYSECHPVFILPLCVYEQFGVRILSWCGYQYSDYCAPIVNLRYKDAFAGINGDSVLRQIARRVRGIDLVHIPKQIPVVGGLKNPFILKESSPYHVGAHAITFKPGESFEQWYARRRSSKTRSRLREKRANLEKIGPVQFSVAQSPEEARELISLCLDTKSEQLERAGHWNPFSPIGVKETLIDHFSKGCGQTAWAVALKVGGANVVTAFGFRGKEEWLLYQMAMSNGPEARFSPGAHLLLSLIKHCIEEELMRLDLALGDETYKAEWCDDNTELVTSALALTARGKLLREVTLAKSRVSAKVAANPRLYSSAKWVKGIASKLLSPK